MSTVHCNTVQTSSGGPVTLTKQSANKGYINFSGAATGTLTDSFNQSGITDGGTGIFACAFVSSMSSANYGHTNGGDYSSGSVNTNKYDSRAAGTFNCRSYNYAGNPVDAPYISLAYQGDLA
jgi:hypothetical protein